MKLTISQVSSSVALVHCVSYQDCVATILRDYDNNLTYSLRIPGLVSKTIVATSWRAAKRKALSIMDSLGIPAPF